MRWALGVVVAALVAGCGDDVSAGGTDAGVDGGLAIAPPVAPAPVSMAPCPDGWREVADGDVVVCDPWPATGPAECAGDEAHFVGEPGCARIGTECPPDGLPVLPAGATAVYVLAEAPSGGDGSRARPFQRIADASPSLGSGTTLALGRGTYTGRFRVPDGVTVRGACVAETIVTAPATTENQPTLYVTLGSATVANLTVTDTGGPALMTNGAGVGLTVEDVVVRRATLGGLVALMGSSIAVRNSLVDEMRPRPVVETLGRCIDGEDGASITLTRVVARRCRDVAVFAGGPGASLTATGLVVRDTLEEVGTGGRGVDVESGASGSLEQSVIEGSHQAGLYVGADAARLTLDHVVIRGTRAQSRDGNNGEGILVELGAHVSASSVSIEDSDEAGVVVRDPGSTLDVGDFVVRDTLGVTGPDGSGVGIAALQGGTIDGARILVERARTAGIAVLDGSSAALEDATVRDVVANVTLGTFGRGIDTTRSTLRLRRADVRGTHEIGVVVSGEGAMLDAEDLAVRDTMSNDVGGELGMAMVVQLGASGVVARGLFERSHAGGVFAVGAGTRAELTDVAVHDVLRPPCAAAAGCALPVALGLASVTGATMTTSRFEVIRGGDCGVQVARDGSLDLHDGLIAHNAIGACVQTDGYALSRLSASIVYTDNERNLDATVLPVPTAVGSVDAPVP